MNMDYFERVKEEMSFQGLTQKELSDKTGISINTIRGWFSKKVLPDLESAYKIAQVLKQPLEYLINGDIFQPNNFHLPTREIKLIENYRKLNERDKLLIDTMAATMSSESHSSGFHIEDNSLGIVANFDDKTPLQK